MKYRMLKDSQINNEMKAGQIVYRSRECDYGLANDDTRATGIEHISVTTDPDGRGNYSFTIPVTDIEEVP